jgi:hypothetical protein
MKKTWPLLATLLLLSRAASPAPDDKDKDDDDDRQQTNQQNSNGPVKLTPAQQQAVGIRSEHPLSLKAAATIEAYGTVLDPVQLVTDLGHVASTQAAAAASSADSTRLERLYRADNQASLKSLQAAQAQSVEAGAQARAAQLGFAQQWGPLASLSATERESLLAALSKGQRQLLRADVPGRLAAGALDPQAQVLVDGVTVSARVLGALPRTDPQTQSAGWLLELEKAPAGFGPGARALVQLRPAHTSAAVLVPATALIYAAEGTYVYRQSGSGGDAQYAAVTVQPLTRGGDAWLVQGVAPGDQVVVQGAGVLWSLQGLGSFSAAEEDHD